MLGSSVHPEYGYIFYGNCWEQFEYTDKIAGIGYVHMVRPEFTSQETLLFRAEANIFLGNHDLPRCLTLADHDLEKVKAAWLLLCLLDGELNLYYGDEQALTGGQDPAALRVDEGESVGGLPQGKLEPAVVRDVELELAVRTVVG